MTEQQTPKLDRPPARDTARERSAGGAPSESAGRRRGRPPLLVSLSLLFLAGVAVCAVLGTWLAPQDPSEQDPSLSVTSPGGGHLLGTDVLGRDVFSRVIVGTLSAVAGPLIAAIGILLIGTLLGLLAGYHGGRVDAVISRGADMLYSMPALLVAIVVVGIVSGSYVLTIGVIVVLNVPGTVRLVRSAAIAQARLSYVDAARALGVRPLVIVTRHILPNVMPTVVATFLLEFVTALVSFSALSFLGLGVAPGSANWGTMLAEGQELIFDNPMMSLAPALLIVATATSATIAGDWLYDRTALKAEAR
ncbi:ABC transporter permease [Streptomyces sp. NPDC051018]|uniref:ABC transporter permease n=1 Tax=Streptomyces sp. NPDC051018 TaxID=3365639 RepID=UPI0037939E17